MNRINIASVVLVLNEMVLVLVIESFVAIEHDHEHRHPTEHEITKKSREQRRNRTVKVGKDEDFIRGFQMPLLRS